MKIPEKIMPRFIRLTGIAGFLAVITVHIFVVCSVALSSRPVIWKLHNDCIHREGPGADFYSVYHAGNNLRRGISPYALNREPEFFYYPFRYLPAVAMGGRLVSLLPPEHARIGWILVLEILLAGLIAVLWKKINQKPLRLFASAVLLLSSPYFLELYMGQFTFAAVALTGLGIFLPIGFVLFASAALLKVFPLAVVPAMVLRPGYRIHCLTALLSVIALSCPYFMANPDDWKTFVSANFTVTTEAHCGNFGLVHILGLIKDDAGLPLTPGDWVICMSVFRISLLCLTTALVFISHHRSVLPGAVALLLAHFLTYPHVWEHHMSGVIAAGALLCVIPGKKFPHGFILVISLVMLAVPTSFALFDTARDPEIWDPSISWPAHARYIVPLTKVAPTLMLFCLAIRLLLESNPNPFQTSPPESPDRNS